VYQKIHEPYKFHLKLIIRQGDDLKLFSRQYGLLYNYIMMMQMNWNINNTNNNRHNQRYPQKCAVMLENPSDYNSNVVGALLIS